MGHTPSTGQSASKQRPKASGFIYVQLTASTPRFRDGKPRRGPARLERNNIAPSPEGGVCVSGSSGEQVAGTAD